ncbi:hypothetical protein [Streptomyces wuyuanensis]|uniref:hypothetical protein n=1 Tax=Streptomyces wuyuanensis TaxID=1196353 RepID=UPI0037B5BDAB
MDGGVPTAPRRRRSAAVGPAGLAVVLADGDGLVSHWSAGARALFGHDEDAAVGQPAIELLPVAGALTADAPPGSDSSPVLLPPVSSPDSPCSECSAWARGGPGAAADPRSEPAVFYPAAGRARLGMGGGRPRDERVDVLWWAYPLVGPGPERLLVLAADAERFASCGAPGAGAGDGDVRIAPGFALRTELPDSGELVRRLAGILPGMGVRDPGGIVNQVRELGCPVVEFRRHGPAGGTPDRGVPRSRSFAPGGAG